MAPGGEALEAEEEREEADGRRQGAHAPRPSAKSLREAGCARTIAEPMAGKYQKRSARTVGSTTGMFDTGKYETTIHTSAERDERREGDADG